MAVLPKAPLVPAILARDAAEALCVLHRDESALAGFIAAVTQQSSTLKHQLCDLKRCKLIWLHVAEPNPISEGEAYGYRESPLGPYGLRLLDELAERVLKDAGTWATYRSERGLFGRPDTGRSSRRVSMKLRKKI